MSARGSARDSVKRRARTGSTIASARAATAAIAALIATASLSCKMQLTPDSIAKTYKGIRDAQKDLTPENEYYVGRSVATNLLARHDYRYADADALQGGSLDGFTAYLDQVGQVVAIAALATPRKGDRPAPISGWHFVMVEAEAINGFAAPGGWIFVTRGAVEAAKDEDELAALLAHEVAHVIRGHALGTIKKSRWAGVAKEALDSSVTLDAQALGDLTKVFDGAMDDMIDATLVKGYSRDTEYSADKVATEILIQAGYDPRALVGYLKTLASRQDTGSGGFYATHPKSGDRIKKLEKHLAKIAKMKRPKARKQRFQEAIALLAGGDVE